MYPPLLTQACRSVVGSTGATAGTTDVATGVIDRTGAERARATAILGDVTTGSVLTLKAQKGNASDGTDMADITGASVSYTAGATDADGKILSLDVVKPVGAKYLKFILQRGTANAVVAAILVDLYDFRNTPPGGGDVIATAAKQG
jgi:ribosomal protein S28E/S33